MDKEEIGQSKGTIFNLDDVSGDWFEFFESTIDIKTGDITYADPKPGTGRVCLRDMSVFWRERQRSRKKKTQIVRNSGSRGMEQIETLPTAEEDAQEREDAFDYSITGLENFFDAKGKSIKCTKENKVKLLAIPVFDRFIARCFELQQNMSKIQAEVAEKNSSTP